MSEAGTRLNAARMLLFSAHSQGFVGVNVALRAYLLRFEVVAGGCSGYAHEFVWLLRASSCHLVIQRNVERGIYNTLEALDLSGSGREEQRDQHGQLRGAASTNTELT